ncbi:acyl-CoA thioesterase [Helicobacter jaachi]|uniref:Acyl-CoA thioesterase n=1 Tax=Helicobacter jaachi TaxID=1677920 RepID=A0A4U8TBU6_9HELI|nr:thioesterase family protein [Helicobacter jaachi]TLD97385.1 acyl-CoA thioesterase [Helicobacter jaachi]
MNNYRVRVYFEDTDCGQIVYHTNYIKYCERARSEIFFAHDMQPFMDTSGFVLKHLQADFISSARLGDLLEVRSYVDTLKNASVSIHQEIYRIYNAKEQAACEDLVFKACITLAFIDVAQAKPCKIPPFMREILSALQAK